MKELRGKSGESLLRVLYAFDPRRTVILLIGGDELGNESWYEAFVPIAARLFDEHLASLKKEIRREKYGEQVQQSSRQIAPPSA